MVDEEIVVARAIGHQVGKSARLEKERFAISQVTSHTHVGMTAEGCSEVVQTVEQRIETHEAVHVSFIIEIRTKAQDDVFRSLRHHRADPVVRLRPAVGVGQQQSIILRRFGTKRQRQFFRRTDPCAHGNECHMQARILR